MWPKFYQDYPVDTPLIKEKVKTGKGIIGCQMAEPNGWGNSLHIPTTQWGRKGSSYRESDEDSPPFDKG